MRNCLWPLVISLSLAACVQEQEPKQQSQPPVQVPEADIEAGKAIAAAECSGCHGIDGRGAAPGIPHLAAQVDDYLVESLHDYKRGRRTHAALHDLTSHLDNDAMRNVAAFYAGLSPVQDQEDGEEQDELTAFEEGERLAASCEECHGEHGISTTPGIPSLAGQQPRYLMAATQAYLHGLRDIDTMEESLRGLSLTDLEKIALYFASRTPEPREAPPFGDPAAGEPLSGQCGGCHGASGVSHDAATPSLAGQDPWYLVNAAKAYRGHVRQHDVMFASRSDQELEHIAAYYAVQTPHPAEPEPTTAEKVIANCDRCHAPGVDNPSLVIPKINGQDEAYLIMALRAYRDERRESSMMHKISLPYSDTLIQEVAAEYAGRPAR